MKLKVLDLFSGIGGFSLGLERTGGFETVAFCEIEEYPRKVLNKHWPGVPVYEDIKELTAERLMADGIVSDVITGGFPCQDISVAGKQKGIEAERSGLWSELARLIGEIRPKYAIVENVTALLSGERGRWFQRVLGDLAEIGYDTEWHCIPASNLGADHERDRVYIITYPNESQCEGRRISIRIYQEYANACCSNWWQDKPDVERVAHGIPNQSHRLKAIGNAVIPQISELIGRAILESIDENKSQQLCLERD